MKNAAGLIPKVKETNLTAILMSFIRKPELPAQSTELWLEGICEYYEETEGRDSWGKCGNFPNVGKSQFAKKMSCKFSIVQDF